MAGGDGFEGGLEPGVGFDANHFRRFDERGDTALGSGAFVVAREQRILSCKGDWAGEVFDTVAVHLDTAVGEEELDAVPVARDIGQFLAETGFGRDADAMIAEPDAEDLDQGRGARLPHGKTPIRRVAMGFGLDGIELGNPAQPSAEISDPLLSYSGFPIWKPPSPLSVTRNRSTCNSPSNDSHFRADPDD